MPKNRRQIKRQRLLIYQRLGQRLRTPTFFIALVGLILYILGWLGDLEILEGGNRGLLEQIWAERALLILMIVACILLYILAMLIARTSHVEARGKVLHVQAGLLAVDISYARIKQIRLGQFDQQYSLDKLNNSELSLVEPFEGALCTVVDLRSLPKPFTPRLLKLLWGKFMFTGDGKSLVFLVPDPMVLNQQIDGNVAARQTRLKGTDRYLDPIERAAREQRARQARR